MNGVGVPRPGLMSQEENNNQEAQIAGALSQDLLHSDDLFALGSLPLELVGVDGLQPGQLGAPRLHDLPDVDLAERGGRVVQILLVLVDDRVVERVAAVDQILVFVGLAQHARDEHCDGEHFDRVDDEQGLRERQDHGH